MGGIKKNQVEQGNSRLNIGNGRKVIQILVVDIPEVQSEASKKGIETQAIKFNNSMFNHRPAAAC